MSEGTRLNPTTIAAAAVSSLVTLCVTILVTMAIQNGSREQALTPTQRAEVARLVKDQVNDGIDAAAKAARAQGLTEAQRAEVARAVKEYLHDHPEVVQEAFADLVKRRMPTAGAATAAAPAAVPPPVDKSALVKSNAAALFTSAHQVTLGSQDGDVTLVEFFDYSCGFCKRALPDMVGLMKADPKLKIVLKELPILGPGSMEAAKVAVAVRMQDPGGEKYLEFHEKLLGGHVPANKANALAVAQAIGLDVARIEKDMESDEVKATLEESSKLARTLGITGTPSYVVGDNVVVGAVGIAALSDKVKTARK
jgi:protein-disulfide isomerase